MKCERCTQGMKGWTLQNAQETTRRSDTTRKSTRSRLFANKIILFLLRALLTRGTIVNFAIEWYPVVSWMYEMLIVLVELPVVSRQRQELRKFKLEVQSWYLGEFALDRYYNRICMDFKIFEHGSSPRSSANCTEHFGTDRFKTTTPVQTTKLRQPWISELASLPRCVHRCPIAPLPHCLIDWLPVDPLPNYCASR